MGARHRYRSFVPTGRGGRTCEEVITEPTIFVTRFEYHNLFHISTDWYVHFEPVSCALCTASTHRVFCNHRVRLGCNCGACCVPFRTNAFIVARTLGYTTLNVVFVDGHAMSDNIDEVWHRMFKRVFYIRHLKPTTCFEKAIFIPFGCVGLAMRKCSALWYLSLCKCSSILCLALRHRC